MKPVSLQIYVPIVERAVLTFKLIILKSTVISA